MMPYEENPSGETRRDYFQSVGRLFLSLRGAPYQLAPREWAQIEDWYRRKIPPAAVRDGLRAAYEDFRARPRRGKRGMTLAFCEPRVRQAFQQRRDRRVGGKGGRGEKPDPGRAALRAVQDFLGKVPPSLGFLKPVLEAAEQELKSGRPDENRLDGWEEEIEARLIREAPGDIRNEAEQTLDRDFSSAGGAERAQLRDLLVVRILRDRFRVPHLSLFYY
jgi:hypothetical protein